MGESLNPSLPSRLSQALRPDWSRTIAARRVAAGVLVVLAGVAAVRPDPMGGRADVVVASRALTPGTVLTAEDVRVEKRPRATVPDGASSGIDTVLQSTPAGPVRPGEILTDVRLLGPRLAESAAGRDARLVPLHLNDSTLLDLIRTGDVVDVLAAGPSDGGSGAQTEPRVVATGAVVVLVSPEPSHRGAGRERVVLVALPARTAYTLAGITLVDAVTLTFH